MRKQASLSTFFATKRESSPTEDTTTDWNSVVPESQKNNFKAFAYQTTSNKPSGGSGEKVRIYAPTTSSSSVDLTQNEDFSAKRVISKTRGEEDVNNTVVAPASKKPRVLPGSITKPSSVPSSSSYRNSGPGYGNIVGAKTSYASSFKPPKSTTSYGDIPSDDDDNVKNKPLKIDEKNPLLQQMYKLSFSQKQVLEVIMSRKSVFFTGAAGTGKSYILKILQDVMGVLDMSTKISFTAPTGVAACNIQGLTIHSWSGAGMASEPIDKLLPIVLRSRAAVERWRNTEILVIDEISMMSAELLDKLDIIGRRVRNDLRPFGGIQLVLCGDFFQLPPVGLGKSCKFCFESNVWKELFEQDNNMILLEKVFRQKDDHVFLNLLNELRYGFMSPSTLRVLSDKSQRDEANTEVVTDIRPTKLFSTNQEVDKYNTYEMDLLCQGDQDEASRYFKAFDDGKDPYLNQLRGGTKAPVDLYLKKGAQVMLLKNLSTSRGLVNGARGTVIGFEPSNGRSEYYPFLPRVKFCVVLGQEKLEEVVTLPHEAWEIKQGDKVLASRTQIPLCLAWAISIHKSQGMTIPFLEVSLGRIFECGQAYVALSRATSLEGLILKHFKASCIRAHSQVKQFYQAIKSSQTSSNSDVDTCEVNLKQFAEIFVKEGLEQAPVDEDAWLDAKPKDAIIKRSQTLPPSQPTRNAFAPPPSRVVTPQEVKKVSHPQIIDVDAMEVVTPKQNESVVSSNVPKVPIFSSARTMIVTPTTASSQQPSAIDSNNSKPSEATISDELRKKIEQSRLAALQKLEMYKKRKEEETKAVMEQFNL